MEKRKNVKRIFNVFLSIILILLFFCGDLQVFADQFTCTVTLNMSLTASRFLVGEVGTSVSPVYDTSPTNNKVYNSVTFDFSKNYTTYCYFRNSSNKYFFYKTLSVSVDGHIYGISNVSGTYTVLPISDSYTFIFSDRVEASSGWFYFAFESVTPSPVPTPEPTPTPTPLPVDFDDTQFWGRINDMAEGGWSAVTATFNGIFNNTVFRNLVIYVPLFGAIIYLLVYLLFMGSD